MSEETQVDPVTGEVPHPCDRNAGTGNLLTNRNLVGKDVRLIGSAARKGWPISRALRRKVVEQMEAIVCHEFASTRDRNAAARVLAQLDKINVQREANDIRADIPMQLGVGVSVNGQPPTGEQAGSAGGSTSVAVQIYLPDNGR